MESYSDSKEVSNYPAPGEDFFRHVNGEWLETTEIPAGESRWGSYPMIGLRTTKRLRDIAEALQSEEDLQKGSAEQQVRDFYASGVDMDTRNRLGVEPLSELRAAIEGIADKQDVMTVVGLMNKKGVSSFLSLYVGEDDRAAGRNAFYMGQGGLSMPGRDYYLKDDESSQEVKNSFKKYMMAIFQMLGRTPEEAEIAADAVYQIEYTLAEAALPAAEARVADKNYFKFTLEEAKSEFPAMDWDTLFGALGKSDIKEFVVQQPDFINKVGDLLQTADIASIKDYLEFTLADTYAGSLSQDFVDVSFAFRGQVLSGLKEPKPLRRKVVGLFSYVALKDAVGPLYCREYFDTESKAKLMQMVDDVKDAFRERVLGLEWMTPATKELTLQKLDKIVFKMGHPDEWPDVSGINIQPDAYVQNLVNMSEHENHQQLASLDEPFDFNEWLMPPIMVNACSDQKREMTFPAAVLQPPFFDPLQDDAYNYGAIGGTIGHELTHFFDDEGCKYDVEGNLNDWWSEQDRADFEQLTQAFADYFGSLSADGLQVNGKLTLGENIADVGGIKIAYAAYQKMLEREGNSGIVDGLTPEQRFFTGWARKWKNKVTPELAKLFNLTDPHAPAEIRVNGVLAITPEFHQAFGLQPGDPMYVAPEDMPTLW